MNRPELYQESTDVLINSLLNGKLNYMDCHECAVGNICKKASLEIGMENNRWARVFCDGQLDDMTFWTADDTNEGLALIRASGYAVEELRRVEIAFRDGRHEGSGESRNYFGLCAVLDVLKEIHEVDKVNHTESVEKLETVYQTVSA